MLIFSVSKCAYFFHSPALFCFFFFFFLMIRRPPRSTLFPLHAALPISQQRVRLLALAKVARLLDRRGDMQRAYLQLRNRPLRDRRRLQLERELHRNARETRAAVRELKIGRAHV